MTADSVMVETSLWFDVEKRYIAIYDIVYFTLIDSFFCAFAESKNSQAFAEAQ